MARYVIDPATLLHVVDHGLLPHPHHQLVAPSRIRSDALDLLLDDVRWGRRADKAALVAHERLTEMKMRLLNDRVSRATAWKIARDQGWSSVRDAEYLAIVRLQADALVTVDLELAARAHQVVPVAAVDALLTADA